MKLQRVLESCEEQKQGQRSLEHSEERNHSKDQIVSEYYKNIPDFSLYFDEISTFFKDQIDE